MVMVGKISVHLCLACGQKIWWVGLAAAVVFHMVCGSKSRIVIFYPKCVNRHTAYSLHVRLHINIRSNTYTDT